jgi:hypothetical protein
MLSICEKEYEKELNFESSISFISQVKDAISDLGCRVVKGYFESRDQEALSLVLGGKKYLNKGKSRKQIVTSLGKIAINRSYYQHRSGGKSLFPLDDKLGVKGEILMPDVKEVVLFSCAYNTPEESSRLLEKCGFIKLHATQIKKAVTGTGKFLEASGSGIMDNIRHNETIFSPDILACSLDGVNVLLNQPGKKKGRPLERPTGNDTSTMSSYRNIMKDDQQGINKLIRSVQNYLSRKKYRKTTEKEIKRHLGYFKKHKKFMQYATYLEKGWPIGSGVIEAACKSVVKQ